MAFYALSSSQTIQLAPQGVGASAVGYRVQVMGSSDWSGSLVLKSNTAPPGNVPSYVNLAYQNPSSRSEVAAGTAITQSGAFIVSVPPGDLSVAYTHTAGVVNVTVSPATAGVTNSELAEAFAAAGFETAGQDTPVTMLSAAVATLLGQSLNVTAFGAVGDGVTDDTDAIQRAVAVARAGSTLLFPPSSGYRTTAPIVVLVKGLVFQFAGNRGENGIIADHAGDAITLGTDDGLPYDEANYDGLAAGFVFRGGYLINTATDTELDNELADYAAGSVAIRDWRGGSVSIENASIRGFDWWFWGVQSDINFIQNLTVAQCHSGGFFGPRSDQLTATHVWSYFNDRVWDFTGAQNAVVKHWITDQDGSDVSIACRLRNSTTALGPRYSTTRIQSGTVFSEPWVEQQTLPDGASTSMDTEAKFEVNVGDTTQGGGLVIISPTLRVPLYSAANRRHLLYLVKADNTRSVRVTDISGVPGSIPWNNLRAVFEVVDDSGAAATVELWFSDSDRSSGRLVENYSATACNVHIDGGQNTTYTTNVVGGTGSVFIGQTGLQRKLIGSNAAPSSGIGGDIVLNRTFSPGRMLGWVWDGVSAAVPIHAPMMSGDRGNADRTLTPGTDYEVQLFATTLTADRAVTLSTTGALNGHVFHVVRSADGAFNLNVGTGPLKALATGEWCDVMYNGSAWVLVRYGSL